jgi:hypothetical protein
MDSEIDLAGKRRTIRLRIARTRRQFDRRLRAVEREGRRLASWPTWLRWSLGQPLLAALGFSVAASAGLRPRRWVRVLGRYVSRRTKDPELAATIRQLADRLSRLALKHDDSAPEASRGVEHG